MGPLLAMHDVDVHFATGGGTRHAVSSMSFDIARGEYLGIVGESGCGKSTLLRAVLGLLPSNAEVSGSVMFDDTELINASPVVLRDRRWSDIALVSQSAMNAFDPVMTIRRQMVEAMEAHGQHANGRPEECFRLVGLDPHRLDSYAHQFSGGMRQRAAIAMAMVLEPALILADEPTTGLDVIMQDQVLGTLKRLQVDESKTLILVTHNMAAVRENCERTIVMYAGELFESGPTSAVLGNGFNPYTLGLRNAVPEVHAAGAASHVSIPGAPPSLLEQSPGCPFAPRCPFATDRCREEDPPVVAVDEGHLSRCHYPDRAEEFRSRAADPDTWRPTRAAEGPAFRRQGAVSDGGTGSLTATALKTWFPVRRPLREFARRDPKRWVHAVDGVTLSIEPNRILGLAGESGSGKSTTGMSLAGLMPNTAGAVHLDDLDTASHDRAARRAFRRRVQVVFQDPFASLNPRFTVQRAVEEPLRIFREADRQERRRRVLDALELAELSPAAEYLDRYPHQLSGGQRQRVAIARAIVLEPEFIIADEPVSMLDVSVRAGILRLLRRLVSELQIGLLYITHDLSTMQGFCDEVAVLYLGQIVEQGPPSQVLDDPRHPYTQALVAAVPRMDPDRQRARVVLDGEPRSPLDPEPGCRFANRCAHALPACRDADPPFIVVGPHEHRAACLLYSSTDPTNHRPAPVATGSPERRSMQ